MASDRVVGGLSFSPALTRPLHDEMIMFVKTNLLGWFFDLSKFSMEYHKGRLGDTTRLYDAVSDLCNIFRGVKIFGIINILANNQLSRIVVKDNVLTLEKATMCWPSGFPASIEMFDV